MHICIGAASGSVREHGHTRLLIGIQIGACGSIQHLGSVNPTLPVQLPAPVETRQFVDDLTTMVVAFSEDDVVTTICVSPKTHFEQK